MRESNRINLGAGKKPLKGYLNVDTQNLPDIDIVDDFRKLKFVDLDEVRASHLLEHFSREEAVKVLELWHSWLKPNGILVIETPDFQSTCRDFLKDPYWMTRHSFGSQENEWSFHKDGWYEDKFREILPKIGFEITKLEFNKTRKILPNIKIVAKKV